MKAVEIGPKTEIKNPKKEEFDEFCKKKFNLELTGEELLAMLAIVGKSSGEGFCHALDGFYDDNKNYLIELQCFEDLLASVNDFYCHKIDFD